jgi:hypothetical protein
VQLAKSPIDQQKFDAGIESASSKTVNQPKAKKPKVKNIDPVHTGYTKCVDAAVQAGRITGKIGQEILRSSNPAEAISGLVNTLSRQKRNAAVEAVRLANAWTRVESHEKSMYDGLMSLMSKDPSMLAKGGSVETETAFYLGKYHAKMAETLSRFRTRDLGWTQDKEGLREFVRGVYGETVADPNIVAFAKDHVELRSIMVDDFNRAGGSIKKNKEALFPQVHDSKSMLKATKPIWMERVKGLNYEIRNKETGEPINPVMQETALDSIFESITTGGLNKVGDFEIQRKGGRLSSKGSDQRVLYFTDAESWLAYHAEFGRGDTFTALTDNMEAMASDTALMSVFGPNPDKVFQALFTQAQKTKPFSERQKWMVNAQYNVTSGKVNQGEMTSVADFAQTARNITAASMLYRAAIASISDVGSVKIHSQLAEISSLKVFNRALKLMLPTMNKEEMRIFGVKLGLMANQMIDRAGTANRFADVYGTGLSTKLAGTTMRSTGLAGWTESMRKAFGMEFAAGLADNFSTPWSGLSLGKQKIFETYNISEKDWDAFRATKTLDHEGARFADTLQVVGAKFHRMILSETDYAVPTPNTRVQALTTGGLPRADLAGTAWRSATQFSSFSLTMSMYLHNRGLAQAAVSGKAAYFGQLAVYSTVLGAIALIAKDLVSGKEPQDMDNAKFFRDAFIQGGAGGIFIDFFAKDQNRYGSGSSAGPVGQLSADAVKLTWGNLQQAAVGDDMKLGSEAIAFASKYSPNAWPISLFKTAFTDQLRMAADPSYEKNLKRIMRKHETETGAEYWWRRGEVLPEALQNN